MSKKALWIEAIVFLAFIFAFFILNTALPDREFSEQENRSLQQRPAFSFDELFSGQYTKDFEAYTTDQFTLRDEWITLKAASELALGKRQNNGMFLCDGGTIIEPYEAPEDGKLEANMEALNKLVANTDADVYFALIPGKSDIWAHMLPQNAPRDSEKAAIDYCYSLSDAVNVDIYGKLEEHSSEYIYYRTDHHWTTHGAYLAYEQFCALKGLTPFDPSAEQTVEVPDFYGTHYSATRFWNAEPDTITYYSLDNPMTIYQLTGEASFEPVETVQLMDPDKLETQDKYGAFLHGNNGYSVIEGDGEGSILVVKDSYGNCFVPYLTKNYAKIGVVDFRDFHYGLDTTIEKEGYDQILILYNFQTFMSDRDVINLIRPSTLQ